MNINWWATYDIDDMAKDLSCSDMQSRDGYDNNQSMCAHHAFAVPACIAAKHRTEFLFSTPAAYFEYPFFFLLIAPKLFRRSYVCRTAVSGTQTHSRRR